MEPVFDETGLQVYVFDPDGSLLEHHSPFAVLPLFGGVTQLNPDPLSRTLAFPWHFPLATGMAVDAGGRRIYIFGRRGPILVAIDPDGRPVEEELELFSEELTLPFVGEEAVVEGEILLRGKDPVAGAFDNVSVSSGGRVLLP